MPKSSKRFVMSDQNINEYGFAVLSEGIDLAGFSENPIMLWMHNRASSGKKDDVLPLGYWEDIKLEDGKVIGTPVFDDDDEFAMSIYKKVENGTIRMASAGLKPVKMEMLKADDYQLRTGRGPSTGAAIKLSDGEDDMIPLLTASRMKECSLVDIGANAKALALYDDNDQVIELSSADELLKLFLPNNSKPASKPPIDMEMLKPIAVELKLADNADAAAVLNAVKAMAQAKTAAEAENATLKLKLAETEINGFLDGAEKEGKIVAAEKAGFLKLALSDFDSVKSIVNARQPYVSAEKQLDNTAEAKTEAEKLTKLSWSELDKGGHLLKVKNSYPEIYKLKFKEQFGTEPK